MPRPGRQPIVDLLKPLLKERGFLKLRQAWHKPVGDFIQVFHLQSGAFGDYYFFNAGIYIRPMGGAELPTGDECHLRYRLDSHLRDQPGCPDVLRMAPLLKNQKLPPWEERVTHIKRLVLDVALPWLEQHSSKVGIARLLREKKEKPRSHPHEHANFKAYKYARIKLEPSRPVGTKGKAAILGKKSTAKGLKAPKHFDLVINSSGNFSLIAEKTSGSDQSRQ